MRKGLHPAKIMSTGSWGGDDALKQEDEIKQNNISKKINLSGVA